MREVLVRYWNIKGTK